MTIDEIRAKRKGLERLHQEQSKLEAEINASTHSLKDELDKQLKIMQNCTKDWAPVLFVGSGISRRYLKLPNWEELLQRLLNNKDLYKKISQQVGGNYEKIAQEIEFFYFRNCKDDKINKMPRRNLMREEIANIIKKDTDKKMDKGLDYSEEVEEFMKISPASIITTNYDELLEKLFGADYKVIVGQNNILEKDISKSKCIYKIHGSIKQVDSILITKEDYDSFFEKSKYLYSKVLTTFLEYPLIFLGYSLSDRNIIHILTTIVEMMSEKDINKFSERIYILSWLDKDEIDYYEKKEIKLYNGKSINVTNFVLKSFKDFFNKINTATKTANIVNNGEDLKFSISEEVIELLIEPLYKSQNKLEVVVREMLQNALDACNLNYNNKGIIYIRFYEDKQNSYIEVEDNGIGMNESDIKENYLTIGKTSKKFSNNLTGKYGIGALSMFLIGNSAEIFTKKENETCLSFKLYIKDGKKQGEWNRTLIQACNISNECCKKSFTQIKLTLSEKINASNCDEFINEIGLDNYIIGGNKEINISFKGENKQIVSISNIDWFEQINLNKDCNVYLLDENKLQENYNPNIELHKIIKNILKKVDEKSIILYNDMISEVVYDKVLYPMMKYIKIPFLWLSGNCEKYGLETELSRSVITIKEQLMHLISKTIYKRGINEIEENLELYKGYKEIQKVVKYLLQSCGILKNVDLIMKDNKISLDYSSNVSTIYTNWDNDVEIVKGEKYIIRNGILDKASLGKCLEYNNVIYMSTRYLGSYILNASSWRNGLKKDALLKVINQLGFEENFNSYSSNEIWKTINSSKNTISNELDKINEREGIIYLNYSPTLNNNYTNSYILKVKNEIINEMDSLFIELLKEYAIENPESKLNEYFIIEN